MDNNIAREYFDKIPTGHSNPLLRPMSQTIDRKLRMMINDANNRGDCIINVGKGYYRPRLDDPVDAKELDHYLNKELHRAREILNKRRLMKDAAEKLLYVAVAER